MYAQVGYAEETTQNPTNTNVRFIQLMGKRNNIQSQESSNILISSKLI